LNLMRSQRWEDSHGADRIDGGRTRLFARWFNNPP